MPLRSTGLIVAVAALFAVAGLLVAASGHGSRPSLAPSTDAEAWRGLVGGLHGQIPVGQRMLVLLDTPSLADRVAVSGGLASGDQEQHWSAAAAAAQHQLLFELIAKGVRVRPEYRYTRLVNGFSAALDARAVALLERAPQVRGVYPVRVAYPATVSRTLLQDEALRLGTSLEASVAVGGFDGTGVTVALLDTGVDRTTPFLHGHVLSGLDVLGHSGDARPQRRPGDSARLELHGTETAGILVGTGGPAGLAGVASGATVLPIRVAGWQADGHGSFSVYARTDQILAGLEKAVDPNGDGDAHDAARIALVPLVEPFAAFADGPLAEAVRGAMRLDTLVVAAAGNDGPAGPAFGSVGGPGGAPQALAVGAADLRARLSEVRVVVRTGLDVLLRRRLALAGAVAPRHALRLDVVTPPRQARGLFDERGYSLVAGKAVLVPAGNSPRAAARRAIEAGAAVVLLAGGPVPPGGLGLDEGLATPVIGVPSSLVREVQSAAGRRLRVSVAIGRPLARRNEAAGKLAPFSSEGLAYGGNIKPELVGPGVGLATAEPGAGADGTSRFVMVSGSSAAAATAAGAAALVLQARPGLSATELRGVLVGSARRLPNEPLAARGAGLVDAGGAVAAEIAAVPATLSFGRGSAGWITRRLVVRNLSSRALTVYVGTPRRRQARVALEVRPRRLELAAGGAAQVRVRARVVRPPQGPAAAGSLTVTPLGGATLHVPWSIVLDTQPETLLGPLQLSRASFEPSELAPSVISVVIGRVARLPGSGSSVQPAERLDVQLRDASGKLLGVLARVRDVLPGRYAFGLTGHDPRGKPLAPGKYRLRLVAWPTDGGPASVRSVEFRIG